jgi:fused signal recognition particle receptor
MSEKSFFRRLTSGLSRSASKLGGGLKGLASRKLDAATVEELEELLIQADVGADTAAKIARAVSDSRPGRSLEDSEIRALVAGEIEKILAPVAKPFSPDGRHKPFVTLAVGVNGSGKTTTLGKLAARLQSDGNKVMLAAADTFRAAAIDQLKVWGERVGAEVVAKAPGADPAGVAYEALEKARASSIDVLLVDTAGRLQNKTALMDELEKVNRVLRKLDPAAPHAVLLILDATVGQNALSQVEAFAKTAGVSGLILTKLDGTAKGGILVALAARFGLPVHFIGIGEALEDLTPFDARAFSRALVGLSEDSEAP